MKNFIEILYINGTKCSININHIIYFQPTLEGTYLQLIDNHSSLKTKESYEDIIKKIEAASK